jgi:hypothetical protein
VVNLVRLRDGVTFEMTPLAAAVLESSASTLDVCRVRVWCVYWVRVGTNGRC